MLEIIGGIALTIFLISLAAKLPILGFILIVVAAFFYPWLWVLVIIYIILMIIAIIDIGNKI